MQEHLNEHHEPLSGEPVSYEPPELVCYGDLAELTRGAGGTGEAIGGTSHTPVPSYPNRRRR